MLRLFPTVQLMMKRRESNPGQLGLKEPIRLFHFADLLEILSNKLKQGSISFPSFLNLLPYAQVEIEQLE